MNSWFMRQSYGDFYFSIFFFLYHMEKSKRKRKRPEKGGSEEAASSSQIQVMLIIRFLKKKLVRFWVVCIQLVRLSPGSKEDHSWKVSLPSDPLVLIKSASALHSAASQVWRKQLSVCYFLCSRCTFIYIMAISLYSTGENKQWYLFSFKFLFVYGDAVNST